GTQKNRTVSVAVAQVDSEELEISNRPLPNVQQSLIGAVPGLIINQTSGRLGQSMDIKVRSVSALQDRNALVLIDGFEGSIDDVNPADIESVSVLKDAAATAIYGARSANGVVLITTKNTKRNDKLSLTYNFNQSIQKPAQTAELANSVEFIEFSNEATLVETLRNDPDRDPSTISLPFSDEELARAQSGFYPDTKWVDEVYSKNAGQSSHNITVAGGSEKTGYFINLGYLNQNGLVAGSENLKRYNIRVKLDTDITKWLTIGTNVSNVVRNTNNVPVSEGNAIRGRPFFPVQLEDGTYVDKGAAGGEPNPVGRSASGSYVKEQRDALNLQMYAQIKPMDNLVFEGRISYTKDNNFIDIWNTPYEFAILDMELNQVGENIPVIGADRNLLFRSRKIYKLNTLVTARYDEQFNEVHNLNVLLGFQAQDGESIMVEAERFNYILPTLQDLQLGQEINGFGNSSARGDNRTTVSYFTRLAYDFQGKYLAEFNFRADASSNFGPNNQWGYFPAVSVGWNVADEGFMSNLSFVDIFKIRASWGLNGDDGSINAVEKVDFNPSGVSFGGVVLPTLNLGDAINPDLKWETSEKTNLGLDFTLWQGKLGVNAEYFIDKRRDIITPLLTSVEGGLTITNSDGDIVNG
ncbi:MAG: SusC/RagA family TonB-linked outer membrane protein, partial [Cyclobacteriaceae bacterium]|nr:SusC/RagA family TonB-linked outer membrane protein [Cyclobacteriaceae bacterium]